MPRSAACDLTYERAICADSFITSPSCPVRIRLPWPFEAEVAVASTNSTSPPEPVTARPVATPGTTVRAATSLSNLGLPRNSRTRCCVISTGGVSASLSILAVTRRGVEHVEHTRRRAAPPAAAALVDLVEHDHRVLGPGPFECRHDAARKRADVGAPVAADVRLIADAAERHTRELAAEGASDRLAQRGLAYARRADQGDDRAGAAPAENFEASLLAQLADREELGDALLRVGQASGVLVEASARFGEAVVGIGAHFPADGHHPG